LPNLLKLPLPARIRQSIQEHEIASLKTLYGDGENLVFNLFEKEFNQLALHTSNGENIQAHFVRNVLRELFPRAMYVNSLGDAIKSLEPKFINPEDLSLEKAIKHLKSKHGKTAFQIFITDSAEGAGVQKKRQVLDKSKYLDMPLLKTANGTNSSIDKLGIRNLFGLHVKDRVYSFYIHGSLAVGNTWNPPFGRLMSILQSENLVPDVCFVTSAGLTKEGANRALKEQADLLGGTFRNLTDLKQGEIATLARPIIIFNDTTGKVPVLHAAADLSVVKGPINPFEGLTVGTPTVVFNNKSTLNNYLPGTVEFMKQSVEATGGGKYVSSIGGFLDVSLALFGKTVPLRPFEVPTRTGKTPIQEFLDSLRYLIEAQISQSETLGH